MAADAAIFEIPITILFFMTCCNSTHLEWRLLLIAYVLPTESPDTAKLHSFRRGNYISAHSYCQL